MWIHRVLVPLQPLESKKPALSAPDTHSVTVFFSIRCKRTLFTLLCASGSTGYIVTTHLLQSMPA